MNKNAIVLSGGGGKGAFQVGAISQFFERGIEFDIISGTSVGALNGVMLAQDRPEDLLHVWENIKPEDVYTKHGWFNILCRVVRGRKSVYSLEPLKELLQENIHLERLNKRFHCGSTSLVSGEYTTFTNEDFQSSQELRDAVYASSIMPIYWEAMELKVGQKIVEHAADGGMKNVTPLADILKYGPSHIYIITCNPNGKVHPYHARNIFEVLPRVLDVIMSEVVINDLKQLLFINQLVLQAMEGGVTLRKKDGTILKHYQVTLIQPEHDLGSAIDFSRSKLNERFKLGQQAVINHYK